MSQIIQYTSLYLFQAHDNTSLPPPLSPSLTVAVLLELVKSHNFNVPSPVYSVGNIIMVLCQEVPITVIVTHNTLK